MADSIVEEGGGGPGEGEKMEDVQSAVAADLSRKEKRRERKKMKRRQLRKEIAEKEREEEEKKLNDPEEQRRAMELEEEEKRRMERERKEFELRERQWLEEMEKKMKEEELRRALEEEEELKRLQAEKEDECNEDDDWEYVEEGPAEIIWKGNEIIVRKRKVKVPKKTADEQSKNEASDRPTSNPLPPQTEAFENYHNASMASAEQLLENVAQQVPNFGTEQDKAHCPFHLKTGACRFGQRCSRVHFYPDKACTLLMKNMYNGPGIAWEQDEGLEHTDEEVERSYEEFYEDVHTEFLKYGEIVNFKVCKNSSFHLRGNVYVQYKSLDSAVLAHHSFNGRYFAGKQVQCEYVNVTRWKVAICGEYMKSRLKECSRGSTCNFIHCFRNPGGDYEWADWDKPPPRYWLKEMAALFGYSYESELMDREKSEHRRMYSRKIEADTNRFHTARSKSREVDHLSTSGKNSKAEYHLQDGSRWHQFGFKSLDEKSCEEDDHHSNLRNHDSHSDRGLPDKISERSGHQKKAAVLVDNRDRNEFHEEEYKLYKDREKHHGHMERSCRHTGRKRSVDNHEDGKESYGDEKGEERHVHRWKESSRRHHSSYLDDTDSSDESLDKDKERYRSHKRKRARRSDEDISDDEGSGAKRLEKNSSSEETGTQKSYSKRKKSGRGLRTRRSHSSRISIERNSDVDRYSGHNHIEQDRWKPDSPN